MGLRRSISDHCPLLLQIKAKDWVPKPFRFANAWLTHPEFKSFVTGIWENHRVEAWSGYVLKEKMKFLKGEIKTWNTQGFGCLNGNIENQKQEIQRLDIIDEVFGLDDQEIIRRNEATTILLRDLKRKDSLQKQKARLTWLKDGDLNSRVFHQAINKRRKRNEVVGIMMNGEWVKKVREVKKGIFEFFQNHFKSKSSTQGRPIIGANLVNKLISDEENDKLIAPFSEEEIREAVWDC